MEKEEQAFLTMTIATLDGKETKHKYPLPESEGERKKLLYDLGHDFGYAKGKESLFRALNPTVYYVPKYIVRVYFEFQGPLTIQQKADFERQIGFNIERPSKKVDEC